MTVYEYASTLTFEAEWDVHMTAGRLPPKFLGTGKWVVEDPSQKFLQAIPASLRSDLRIMWLDFVTVLARRISLSKSPFFNEREQLNQIRWEGHSLIVFAPGTTTLDLIVSKYGYGARQKSSHLFYQWQARSALPVGTVDVDNYETSESD